MRIAHLNWTLAYGGIETMLVNIANEQAMQGAEVYIIVINDYIKEELANKLNNYVKLILMKRKSGARSFSFIKKLDFILSEINPDVIHIHTGDLYDVIPSKWTKNKTCIICRTVHAIPHGSFGSPFRLIRLFQRLVLHKDGYMMNVNRVDKVFSISKAVATDLRNKYGVDSTVVCNGIQSESFEKRDNQMFDGELKIVQVSRLKHETKGQDLLILAAGKLATKGHKLKIDFIGDGESHDYLESMVKQLGLGYQVTFLGTKLQEYIKCHLKDYDLFVQPSRVEGFGLTVAEAIAANVPVLVSSGQGPAEVTENDRFGWVFENGDSDSLAKQIEFILNNYNQCLDKVRKAAEHVAANYDVKETASMYLIEYKQVLSLKN